MTVIEHYVNRLNKCDREIIFTIEEIAYLQLFNNFKLFMKVIYILLGITRFIKCL